MPLISAEEAKETQRRLQFVTDLSEELARLHDRNIVHGGIRLENVRINREGKAFFIFTTPNTYQWWAAPELFSRAPGGPPRFTKNSDTYAFGILMWELFTNRKPWEGKTFEEVSAAVRNGERPQ